MSWTEPITWVFRQVMSVTLLNQQIRDNLNYLKTRPLTVANLGSSNQTGITTSWVKVTNSDLQITLPVDGTLLFGWRITATHSVAGAGLAIDVYDVDNAIYLSSGTNTPATWGLQRMFLPSSVGQPTAIAGSYVHQSVVAGTHNYEIRVLSSAASATIGNASAKNSAWVWEIG